MNLTNMQKALKILLEKGSFKKHETFSSNGAFVLEVRSFLHKTELELLQKELGFKSYEISVHEQQALISPKTGSFFIRFDWK